MLRPPEVHAQSRQDHCDRDRAHYQFEAHDDEDQQDQHAEQLQGMALGGRPGLEQPELPRGERHRRRQREAQQDPEEQTDVDQHAHADDRRQAEIGRAASLGSERSRGGYPAHGNGQDEDQGHDQEEHGEEQHD